MLLTGYVMLCYAMPCHLCCVMLHCFMMCYVMLCYFISNDNITVYPILNFLHLILYYGLYVLQWRVRALRSEQLLPSIPGHSSCRDTRGDWRKRWVRWLTTIPSNLNTFIHSYIHSFHYSSYYQSYDNDDWIVQFLLKLLSLLKFRFIHIIILIIIKITIIPLR